MAKKQNKPAAGKGGMSSSLWIAIFAGLVVVVGIAGGVLGWVLSSGGSGDGNGGGIKPPSFAYEPTVPKGTVEAYQVAIDNSEALAQIPCYCGCGQLDGHDSNLDCFIKSRNGDDIVFDKHAAG